MKRLLLLLLLLLPTTTWAQFSPKDGGVTLKSVTVTASNAGVQACTQVKDSCTVSVPTTAAVNIWLFKLNVGTACSAVTQKRGIPLTANGGYVCSPYEPGGYCYNWKGQVCLIRESGSGDIITEVTEQ